MWAPYDEETYAFVLAHTGPQDVVLDIGAGDLRLTFRLAQRVKTVYAIELQPQLVAYGLRRHRMPTNVHVIVGDARLFPFPRDVTIGVLLMRHCPDVGLYVEKLRQAGASALITNARWRLGPEVITLNTERLPFEAVSMGWYACQCGATGFVSGPPEALDEDVYTRIHEVAYCPSCHPTSMDAKLTDAAGLSLYAHQIS